jgi:hypothetical protein
LYAVEYWVYAGTFCHFNSELSLLKIVPKRKCFVITFLKRRFTFENQWQKRLAGTRGRHGGGYLAVFLIRIRRIYMFFGSPGFGSVIYFTDPDPGQKIFLEKP